MVWHVDVGLIGGIADAVIGTQKSLKGRLPAMAVQMAVQLPEEV